ncbi:MAG TPA: DUF4389 domain-containing protein [Mycobacteriales bacterium]|nr:DUF4389 domain-containing protein [Mycobacteriales bacterium]
MRIAKILSVATGALAAVVALALCLGGVALVLVHATQRGADGYYHSGTERLASPTYAITSEHIDLAATSGPPDWVATNLGTVRIRARSVNGAAVFLGIARTAELDRYLGTSAHDQLTDVSFDPFRVTYRRHGGEVRPVAPASQSFWVARATGPGEQSVLWEATSGDWSVVVMNADAAPGVAVDVSVGLRTGLLLPIGLGLLAVGLLAGAVAAALLVLGIRGARPAQEPGTAFPPGVYPVRVDGRLEPELSRWLWLVKWLLAIPHLIVLAFLWVAFIVLTVVAGFSILFTGRYPRGIFGFNVGVLRWTWRVSFYATIFCTDRYPPFSLQPDPTYPADLDVAYPATLSRPLVLVKWWLLALPHLLIISIFGGGLTWWTWSWNGDGRGNAVLGAGLVGLLALVAAVTLAFTKRYPESLFSFVMGMQRWTYRVIAYVALMRDEYPPFRLDTGGTDPASAPPPQPPTPPSQDRPGTLVGG